MSRQMSGKVCLVTGASSGIGESVAMMFASRGASVTLCGRDTDRLKTSLEQCIEASGGHSERFLALSGDLNKPHIRKETVEKTVQKFGRLNVLVANAGATAPDANMLTCSEEDYDILMNTNVKGTAFLIQAAVPHLEKTKGNIVTISSIVSTIACTPAHVYGMSKAAVDHLTRCLVLDLGPKGIRINTVCPSFTPTRFLRPVGEDVYAEFAQAFAQSESTKTPLDSRCVTKEEIAEAVAFLASDAASFITGECMNVDGGRRLRGPLVIG